MTTDEAAVILGVSRAAVIQAIKRETLYAERRGRRWYIEPAEVGRYARQRWRRRAHESALEELVHAMSKVMA